ncbi:unnamed protein product, partial [Medioppia subpectinata]
DSAINLLNGQLARDAGALQANDQNRDFSLSRVPFLEQIEEMLKLVQKQITDVSSTVTRALTGGLDLKGTAAEEQNKDLNGGVMSQVPFIKEFEEYLELFQKQINRFGGTVQRIIQGGQAMFDGIDSGGDDNHVDEDFYAFLNVSKQATDEEITRAYKAMSKRLHPDKHLDPELKKEAEILFNKVKKAYDVLKDPHLRAIYDTIGTKGLETEGWVLMEKKRSPQEIREEYERLIREREDRLLQQRTNPKGNISVQINATDLFDHYNDDWEGVYWPSIEVSSMSISQSIDAPLTLADTLTLSGSLSSHNGTGQGTVATSLRRVISAKTWAEVELAAGQGPVITLKGFRNFTKKMHSNCNVMLHFSPVGVRPGLQCVLSRHLDKHLIGYITFKAGLQSCINTMLAWDAERARIICSVQLGFPHSFLTASYLHKLHENDTKIKVAVKAGTFGAVVEYGCETRLSKHSIIGASISIGVPSGVSLRLRLNRANQSYIFPVLLSDELLPNAIFYGTVAPLLGFYCLKTFIINPYNRRQTEKEKERVRTKNRTKLVERRKEAHNVIELMRESFKRIVDRETQKKGLLITRALYGNRLAIERLEESDADIDEDEEEVYDVVLPLQCLVNSDSTLTITDSSKGQLPGFYDPCIGEDKRLLIRYSYNDNIHQIVVEDNQSVNIPSKVVSQHLIPASALSEGCIDETCLKQLGRDSRRVSKCFEPLRQTIELNEETGLTTCCSVRKYQSCIFPLIISNCGLDSMDKFESEMRSLNSICSMVTLSWDKCEPKNVTVADPEVLPPIGPPIAPPVGPPIVTEGPPGPPPPPPPPPDGTAGPPVPPPTVGPTEVPPPVPTAPVTLRSSVMSCGKRFTLNI